MVDAIHFADATAGSTQLGGWVGLTDLLCLPAGKRLGTAGYFVEPTIFADATDDMDIAKDEIFGPVLTALKWSTLDEVSSCLPVCRLFRRLAPYLEGRGFALSSTMPELKRPLHTHVHSLVQGMLTPM